MPMFLMGTNKKFNPTQPVTPKVTPGDGSNWNPQPSNEIYLILGVYKTTQPSFPPWAGFLLAAHTKNSLLVLRKVSRKAN